VCLTATGVVVTFGGNEAGQCGHSPNKHTKALPMAMTGLAARAPRGCVQVAAGDMFTLCLTAQVYRFTVYTTDTIAATVSNGFSAAVSLLPQFVCDHC
jgi:Regulator of chromosome condensation (RCC1) repeat